MGTTMMLFGVNVSIVELAIAVFLLIVMPIGVGCATYSSKKSFLYGYLFGIIAIIVAVIIGAIIQRFFPQNMRELHIIEGDGKGPGVVAICLFCGIIGFIIALFKEIRCIKKV